MNLPSVSRGQTRRLESRLTSWARGQAQEGLLPVRQPHSALQSEQLRHLGPRDAPLPLRMADGTAAEAGWLSSVLGSADAAYAWLTTCGRSWTFGMESRKKQMFFSSGWGDLSAYARQEQVRHDDRPLLQ